MLFRFSLGAPHPRLLAQESILFPWGWAFNIMNLIGCAFAQPNRLNRLALAQHARER